ncbi:hypothetical protein [Sinorhizobium sp. M4_45]|uniref:hypothetical protein n=1 Tax=Sinorhizobium sp. M4_45 TaxID=2037901 RepID=UPI000C9C19A0|nr:hypothetical protein [Sinorhizobium sp. M4_45]PND27042.1 hypothetical protein CN933_15140 [Sinorhizobium sp. M4_45]
MNAHFGTVVATVALLAPSTIAGSACAATAYELRHAAQLLKERFGNVYFVDAATELARAAAASKTLIHVLAQALAVNDACGLGLDQAQVEDVARRLGIDGPIGHDFYGDLGEQIAEVTGDEAEADSAGTCSDVRVLYEAAAPLVEFELARSARSSEVPDVEAEAPPEQELVTGLSDLIVTAMLSGTCESLVVFGTNFSEHCDGRIVQSVYSTGRAGFSLAIGDKGGTATFSGIEGMKPDADSQFQSFDKVVFTIGLEEVPPNVAAVTGSCVYGNPYKGPVTISCQGTDADNKPYLLQFRTDGSPPAITDFRKKGEVEALSASDSTIQSAASEPAAEEANPVSTISGSEGGATPSASAQPSHDDTKTVRIAYSDDTLTVPMKIDPTISETAPLIDVERMITDEAFAGQSFPDFVCPPGLVLCPKTASAEAKVLKAYATGAYQPTERWCREVEWKASVNGRTNYASGLQMQMLQATLVANNVQPGTEERSFNPYGYYLYRALMAAEVCLGLRQ